MLIVAPQGAYYHNDYHYYVQLTSGLPFQLPYSDNNLINGMNAMYAPSPPYPGNQANTDSTSNCSGAYNGPCTNYSAMATFQFQPGKTHRLRLVNVGGDGIQRFSIDGHVMTVIANDFTPVVPYSSDIISLGVGQRTDIIVTANEQSNSSWWMRSDFTTAPCGISYQPHALAAIYYPEANTSMPPQSTAVPAQTNDSVLYCQNVSIMLLKL